jgi:hypothetical protein
MRQARFKPTIGDNIAHSIDGLFFKPGLIYSFKVGKNRTFYGERLYHVSHGRNVVIIPKSTFDRYFEEKK